MWILLLGVFIGVVLPEIDNLIYVFFINPQELTSQRASYLFKRGNIISAIRLLKETKLGRKTLVFHSDIFLIIVLVLGFWLLTSSASFLGKGIIWGMTANLVVDRLKLRLYHKA